EDRDGAVARVLALGALEYAVLAPAPLCSAIAILVSGEDVPLTLTLPWLLVIPGAFVAVWVTSPKRAPRFSRAGDGGRIRQGFAHAVAGLSTRRSLPAGGAGIVEIALTFALTWVGFPFVRALLGVVVYRLFNLWLPILPALAVLPRE